MTVTEILRYGNSSLMFSINTISLNNQYLKQIVEAVKLWKTNYVSVRKLLLEFNEKNYIFSHKLKFIKIKGKIR